MASPVVHFELWSKDPERISDFYRTVFDWEIPGMGHLTLFADPDGRVLGMWQASG